VYLGHFNSSCQTAVSCLLPPCCRGGVGGGSSTSRTSRTTTGSSPTSTRSVPDPRSAAPISSCSSTVIRAGDLGYLLDFLIHQLGRATRSCYSRRSSSSSTRATSRPSFGRLLPASLGRTC